MDLRSRTIAAAAAGLVLAGTASIVTAAEKFRHLTAPQIHDRFVGMELGDDVHWRGSFWLGMKIDVPVLSSINVASLLLTLGALATVFRFEINMIAVLGTCAAIGVIYYLATGQVA